MDAELSVPREEPEHMRIAVLGCGSIGRRHLKNLEKLGSSDLIAFDPSPNARRWVTSELGVNCYGSLSEVWPREPEVAFITAPSYLHLELAIEAARHNCHLFIEKPLATSLDGIETLRAEVERRRLITMVGCNMRFHPGPRQVKQMLDDRVIGDVIAARIQSGSYLPDWRPQTDYRMGYSASVEQGGGAILDCIHEIDLVLWYFGPGRCLSAAGVPAMSIGLDVEGLAEILIRHDCGVLSSVHLNFVQRDYRRCCQIIGTAGTLYWDFEGGRIRWYKGSDDCETFEPAPKTAVDQMYVDEIRYFLDCIRNRQQTSSNLDSGSAALRIALAAKGLSGPESRQV